MSKAQVAYHSSRLQKYLRAADLPSFLRLIWSVDAIQSNRVQQGSRFLTFPDEAANSEMSSPYAAHKWTLEDLCNEYFGVLPRRARGEGRTKLLNCGSYDVFARVFNALKSAQNAESGMILERVSVLEEMPRIAIKQFEWQRGFFRKDRFFRSAYLFGGARARSYFSEHIVPFEDYTKLGFVLYTAFSGNPIVNRGLEVESVGLSKEHLCHVLGIWSGTRQSLFGEVQALRREFPYLSYRPSVLRKRPLVQIDPRGHNFACPLPELIGWRVSSGLYYDLANEDGIRQEIEGRFEQYCRKVFSELTSQLSVRGDYQYKIGKHNRHTPDLLVDDTDGVALIGECKFQRLAMNMAYSVDGGDAASRIVSSLTGLAKGVFQVWRFCSHIRRGLLSDERLSKSPIGLIVTIDPWLVMTHGRYEKIMRLARAMAAEKEPGIEAVDQIPICFSSIDQLEEVLQTTSDSELLRVLKAAASEKYAGWHLSGVRDEVEADRIERKPFPFQEWFTDVLPWLDEFR